MERKKYSLLKKQEQLALHEALYFMKMMELKNACKILSLPDSGKKIEIIERIMTFIKTGKITENSTIPGQSLAKNYPQQVLKSTALMLYGDYKNDAKTREFFKSLIGQHFHFTAFGIDWLNERWMQGRPPTYQEFADFWNREMAKRKDKKVKSKEEWAYIRFLQNMKKIMPHASKNYLIQSWKKLQMQKSQEAYILLKKAEAKLVD